MISASTAGACNGHLVTSSELSESANGALRSRTAANDTTDKPENGSATLKPGVLRRGSDGSNVSRFVVFELLFEELLDLAEVYD